MENEAEKLQRLVNSSAPVIQMLKQVIGTGDGKDYTEVLKFAGGLAGFACHQTVKAKKESFVVIGTKSGKKFYFGDNLNRYLLEDKYSVLSLMLGVYQHFCPGQKLPDIHKMVSEAANHVGDEAYRIGNVSDPKILYANVGSCWRGIYEDATVKFCKEPSEWPIYFGIILQRIMFEAIEVENQPEKIFNAALESALYISKMDEDSL